MAHQVIWRQEMWPSGLHVMVVDDNSCYLGLMERLLLQCNYKVTTCGGVQEAVSLVMGSNPQGIDLIISDVFLPGDDGLFILKSLAFQPHFPVIMMSWSGEIGMMMKYIAYGACDFLIKPVRIKELRNIWQHVFRKQMGHQAKTLYKLNTASMNNDHMGKKQKGFVLHVQERDDQMVDDVRDLNKSRLHWTTQLHHQFLAAVNALGLDKALPKKILEIMRVQHLTREQVASHLQKYRLQLRKSSSYVPVESVESPTFDASEETQQEFMVVPQAEPPNLTPSLEQTKSMVVESYCTDAGKSSSGSRCTADDMNNCFDHGSFHELCLPLTKQAFESGPCL